MSLSQNIGFTSLAKKLASEFAQEVERENTVQKKYGNSGEDNFSAFNEGLKKSLATKGLRDKFQKGNAGKKIMYVQTLNIRQASIVDSKWKRRAPKRISANPYADIFIEFPKFQVTVTNSSDSEKEIVLWGLSEEITTSKPTPEDVQDHALIQSISLPTGVYPQVVLFNPVNNYIYVANQISGNVSVISSTNDLITEVQLLPAGTGLSSPVAMAVNTSAASPQYGFVFVACSVSGQLNVIDTNFNIIARINVGIRPVAVAYNPFNSRIYVANLTENNLSVINGNDNSRVPGPNLVTGIAPASIAINPSNGDIYVANAGSNSVSVFDFNNIAYPVINGLDALPVSIAYHPFYYRMYVCCAGANTICELNVETRTLIDNMPVGSEPAHCFYNPANRFMYVQNRADSTLSVISDHTVIATLNLGTQNFGAAYNEANGLIYVSDTIYNRVNVIGYLPFTSSVSVNSDYFESSRDFRSNPCQVQHARFILNGEERISRFRHNRFQPTGSSVSTSISFEQFASPQHGMNVAEATALAGTLIDRKMNWRFMLPARHTATILIWFRQFPVADLLKPDEKQRDSITDNTYNETEEEI